MLISVLLPLSDPGADSAGALEAVRRQRWVDWELIVIESGAAAENEPTVSGFARHVAQAVRYEHQAWATTFAVRNRLLELASGDVLAFLDPKDRWDDDHLESAATAVQAGFDLVVTGVRGVDRGTGRQCLTYHPEPELASHPVLTLFRRQGFLTMSSVVFRRRLLNAAPGFNPALGGASERDFWFRAVQDDVRVKVLPTVTVDHPLVPPIPTRVLAEQSLQFYRHHRHGRAVPAGCRRRLLAESCLAWAAHNARHQPWAALALAAAGWRERPWHPTAWLALAFYARRWLAHRWARAVRRRPAPATP